MIDKTVSSVGEAIADIWDGATIMVGGFLSLGTPWNLIEALVQRKVKDLTVISNAYGECYPLTNAMMVKKFIAGYAVSAYTHEEDDAIEEQWKAGKLVVEQLPQGIFQEVIRAGGRITRAISILLIAAARHVDLSEENAKPEKENNLTRDFAGGRN